MLNPNINQRGPVAIGDGRQVIVPNAKFNCNGRITNVAVSMLADCMIIIIVIMMNQQICNILHLRSKESRGYINCVYLILGIQLNAHRCTFRCSIGKWCTFNKHNTLIQVQSLKLFLGFLYTRA